MKIRRRRYEDLADYCELANSWDPINAMSLETRKRWADNTPVDRYRESFVGIIDDKIIACVTLAGGMFADKTVFWLALIVHPDYRGHGYSRKLYDLAERHLNYLQWKRLLVNCRESDNETTALLGGLGFAVASRAVGSILDPDVFEPIDEFEDKLRCINEQGIRITNYSEIDSPEAERKLWRLYEDINADVPNVSEYEEKDFDSWKQSMSAHERFGDTILVALDGDELIGLTELSFNNGRENTADIEITGVALSHRNYGIASVLKYCSILWAKENEVPAIKTGNREDNEYILRINRKLGFKPLPAWLLFEKFNDNVKSRGSDG